MLKKLSSLLILTGYLTVADAHEFWLQPSSYTAPAGEKIQVNWRIGMDFQGSTFVYLPNMATYVGENRDGKQIELSPRFAAKPALDITIGEGTTIAVTESTDFILEYDNFDAFYEFVTKEHLESQFSGANTDLTGPVFESYRRYAKTLISNPTQQWQDRLTGQNFEWLLTRENERLIGTLYIDNEVAVNYPVKLFSKPTLESTEVLTQKAATDDLGQVVFSDLKPDYLYLINAVKLREITANDKFEKAQWHSDWASTTFQW